jgi:hypothetical protein
MNPGFDFLKERKTWILRKEQDLYGKPHHMFPTSGSEHVPKRENRFSDQTCVKTESACVKTES